MAHHLHAHHENEKETARHKSPFIEHTNYSKCPFCDRIESNMNLKKHIQQVHGITVPISVQIGKRQTKEKVRQGRSTWFDKLFPNKDKNDTGHVECPECSEVVEVQEFNKHYIYLHELECDHCHKICKTRYDKRVHILQEHTTTDDSEKQCEFCKKRFLHKSDVIKHVEIHHMKLRNHLCDICGMAFKRKSNMDDHRAKHFNIRLLQCKLCPKRYNCSSMIKKHLRTKHGLVPEGRYNDPFTDKDALPWVKLTIEEDRALQEMEMEAEESQHKNVKKKINVPVVSENNGNEVCSGFMLISL